jgi:peptidyl-prolyl cis-trans isomerase D
MLSSVRKLLENWVARGFFALLVVIFVFWGISNVVTLIGSDTAVAKVDGQKIDIAQVQTAYQTALAQAQQTNPTPDLATRQQIAGGALANVLREQSLRVEAGALHLAAPDSAVREIIYAIPAFQSNGVFSQTTFQQVLQANNRTPEQFLDEVRQNLLDRQILVPLIGSVGPPEELVNQIFSYIAEQRFAEIVDFPTASQPVPAPPGDAVLRRYWRNHPAAFTAPEYRMVQVVILSPALLAVNEFVSDDDVAAAYAQATEGQTAVPLRSVQVITTKDPAKAASLAAAWRNAAGWPSMQALAKQDGANAVELDNAQASQVPSGALANAIFAALPGEVTGPVQGGFGLYVFKVTNVSTSVPVQADLAEKLRQQLKLQKAQADVAQDVNSLQDALAGQTPLDQLPGNIGLVAVEGTMDSHGNAADGTPAPIPGGADLRAAIVKAAFAAKPGQPAALINGPGGSYFALTVGKVIPPALLPYGQEKAKVLAAWTADQVAREAEVKAANLLAAVNAGQDFEDAASAAGEAVTMSPPVTRAATPSGVSPQLMSLLFGMNQGQATMQQTGDGFMVAVLARVVQPTPQQDASDYQQVYSAMAKGMQNDLIQSFLTGLQVRDRVSVNQKLFAQVYQ